MVCVGSVENVKEVLKLTVEGKNGVVTSGELTVILDGLAIDQEPLHNGNAATTTSEYNLSPSLFKVPHYHHIYNTMRC